MLKRLLVFSLCLITVGSGLPFRFAPAHGLSIADEDKLAREFMKMVRRQYVFIEDPLITDYVRGIGERIVRVLPDQPFEYRFFVIRNDDFNAFAGPAGNVFINSGLIAAMDSEEELAGIIAHEISHVACRHISAMIERSKKAGIATLAGIAAGILLGMSGAGEAAGAITMGSFAAGQSVMLAYSRENEMQADQVGLKYLEAAGYESQGLLTGLKKMRSRQWFGPEQIPTYLLTHPATEERIAYLDVHFGERPDGEGYAPPDADYRFRRVQSRLIALYADDNLALRHFNALLKRAPDDPSAHYGLGLLFTRNGNRVEARSHFQRAIARKAMDPHILRDLGKLLYFEGEYEKAATILEGAVHQPPYDPEYHVYLARAKTALNRLGEAAADLERLLQNTPDHPTAMFYLGETFYRQGRAGDAHYYLGRHYHAKGEMRNALFHMEKAFAAIQNTERRQEVEDLLNTLRREIKSGQRTSAPLNGRPNR